MNYADCSRVPSPYAWGPIYENSLTMNSNGAMMKIYQGHMRIFLESWTVVRVKTASVNMSTSDDFGSSLSLPSKARSTTEENMKCICSLIVLVEAGFATSVRVSHAGAVSLYWLCKPESWWFVLKRSCWVMSCGSAVPRSCKASLTDS